MHWSRFLPGQKHRGMQSGTMPYIPRLLEAGSARWRRRRDLNSRAGLSRPTPLAGAPLRPLEYFSVYPLRSPFASPAVLYIIHIFPGFVKGFSHFSCRRSKMFRGPACAGPLKRAQTETRGPTGMARLCDLRIDNSAKTWYNICNLRRKR